MINKIIILIIYIIGLINCYTIPIPTFKVGTNQGFTVSIPDEPGIVLYAFHGKLNKQFIGVEPGEYFGEVLATKDGAWTYENTRATFKLGDTIHYWIYVQNDKFGYRLDGQKYVIGSTTNTGGNINITPTVPVKPANCITSKTVSNGRANFCKGDLIFDEQFDSDTLTKWKHSVEFTLDTEDAEFVSYQKDACRVENGNFIVEPKLLIDTGTYTEDDIKDATMTLSGCTGAVPQKQCTRTGGGQSILPPIVSCKIGTKDTFTFKYGKIEIRAKFPIGDWLFPELFLNPAEFGIDYAYGQMRVGFIRGNERLNTPTNSDISGSVLSGGVVLASGELFRDERLNKYIGNNHFGNDFHVYGLTWSDESIVLSVDGNIYANIVGGFKAYATSKNIPAAISWDSYNVMSPFDREFYISLGIGVGGVSDFPDQSQTKNNKFKPWRNRDPKNQLFFWEAKDEWYPTWTQPKLIVDYVKVWAL